MATPLCILKAVRRLQARCGVVQPRLLQLCHAGESRLPHLPGFPCPLSSEPQAFTPISRCTISSSMSILPRPACAASAFCALAPMWPPGLLKAHSVSVLLSRLSANLDHQVFSSECPLGDAWNVRIVPSPPDFSKRGNPDLRILAIGHWGTYKRLETLMEAFPAVLKKIPNARLIVAGANHHTKAGYWESIREAQPADLPIEFRGYVPEEDIPELFRSTSIVVMPYDSATGSSGPAHQACEYGIPIVCADIPEFREMAADEAYGGPFLQNRRRMRSC